MLLVNNNCPAGINIRKEALSKVDFFSAQQNFQQFAQTKSKDSNKINIPDNFSCETIILFVQLAENQIIEYFPIEYFSELLNFLDILGVSDLIYFRLAKLIYGNYNLFQSVSDYYFELISNQSHNSTDLVLIEKLMDMVEHDDGILTYISPSFLESTYNILPLELKNNIYFLESWINNNYYVVFSDNECCNDNLEIKNSDKTNRELIKCIRIYFNNINRKQEVANLDKQICFYKDIYLDRRREVDYSLYLAVSYFENGLRIHKNIYSIFDPTRKKQDTFVELSYKLRNIEKQQTYQRVLKFLDQYMNKENLIYKQKFDTQGRLILSSYFPYWKSDNQVYHQTDLHISYLNGDKYTYQIDYDLENKISQEWGWKNNKLVYVNDSRPDNYIRQQLPSNMSLEDEREFKDIFRIE